MKNIIRTRPAKVLRRREETFKNDFNDTTRRALVMMLMSESQWTTRMRPHSSIVMLQCRVVMFLVRNITETAAAQVHFTIWQLNKAQSTGAECNWSMIMRQKCLLRLRRRSETSRLSHIVGVYVESGKLNGNCSNVDALRRLEVGRLRMIVVMSLVDTVLFDIPTVF